MGPRRLVALIAVVLGTTVWLAPAAQGGRDRDRDPVARIACDSTTTGPCSESGSIALPPNSFGTQSTDTVPNAAEKASTSLGISNTDANDVNAFDEVWATVVDGYPGLGKIKSKLVRRVITCVVFAESLTMPSDVLGQEDFSATGPAYDGVALAMCLQMAVVGQHRAFKAHDAASKPGCSNALVSVPIEVQRTASGYRAVVNATSYKARGTQPLSVSCRPHGVGLQIKLKPRSRRSTLRQVLGPHLSIGFSNPSNRSLDIHTKYAFS